MFTNTAGALALSVFVYSAAAEPVSEPEGDFWPDKAKLAGESRLSYLFWDVYDIRLFTADGSWQDKRPFALELTYLRDFNGKDIAERSVKEMKGQGISDKAVLERWEKEMKALLPDVEEGDRLTGVADSQGNTQFYYNDEPLGKVEEEAFTDAFFAIWLAENTSEPAVRKALTGERK